MNQGAHDHTMRDGANDGVGHTWGDGGGGRVSNCKGQQASFQPYQRSMGAISLNGKVDKWHTAAFQGTSSSPSHGSQVST